MIALQKLLKLEENLILLKQPIGCLIVVIAARVYMTVERSISLHIDTYHLHRQLRCRLESAHVPEHHTVVQYDTATVSDDIRFDGSGRSAGFVSSLALSILSNKFALREINFKCNESVNYNDA